MAEVPELLDDLLRAPGPSGYEGPATAVWRGAAGFAEVTHDALGSSVATVGDDTEQPLLAVVGHIDEIGVVITHVDDKGFLHFGSIGGWDAQILVGQRIVIDGRDGPVLGVVGRKPIHLLDSDARKKVVEIKQMHIDIGAADEDEALSLVGIGDAGVVAGEPAQLAGSRLASRSLDNRLGCYIALEAARRAHERGKLRARMAAVAAVQEEIGSMGAGATAYALRPDVAIAVDVTHATDAPGVEAKELGSHSLGSGPVLFRGARIAPRVYELLVAAAESADIEYTVEASGSATHTDADSFQISRAGIPTGLVSIPLRYMHSPVEVVDLEDVDEVVELLVAFAERLDSETELLPS
jgi:putative aminopeptidase FrvX